MRGERISIYEALRALEENEPLLSPEKYKIARNTNIALQGIANELSRLSLDLERLHTKLQPILKSLEEDNSEFRVRYPRTEFEKP